MSSALRPASISRASTDARWGTRDNVNVGEAPSEGHRRVVDRGHLSRQHRLDLIPWLDPLDDGEHEICALFRSAFSFAGAGVYEMPHQAIEEVEVSCSYSLHQSESADPYVGMLRLNLARIARIDRDFEARPAPFLRGFVRCERFGFDRRWHIWLSFGLRSAAGLARRP